VHYLVTVNVPGADDASMNVKLEGQRLHIPIKTDYHNGTALTAQGEMDPIQSIIRTIQLEMAPVNAGPGLKGHHD